MIDPELSAPGVRLHRFEHEAMACTFGVCVAGATERYARQAAAAAFAEVDRLEALLSRFVPYSDIARVNALALGEFVRVSLETRECLELASQVYRDTGGAFDVAYRVRSRLPTGEPALVFDPQTHSLGVRVARCDLDLGGLGKGFAVDRAVAVLREWNIAAVLVHSGQSTVRALGARTWRVALRAPGSPSAACGTLELRDAALSGSGQGRQPGHIRDPRTGQPSTTSATWAVAPSAALSDALSTAFMNMPVADVATYVQRHPAVGAILMPVADAGTGASSPAPLTIGEILMCALRRCEVSLGVIMLGAALNVSLAGDPPPEEQERIRAAIPDKAPAAAAKARRLLVYSGAKGFVHTAIPYGAATLRMIGEKTGAFEAVLSDDPNSLSPESLKAFDAVCINNATGDLFDDAAWKQGLLDFVRDGKGLVGIHAATDCFYQWPEYGELIGGYFDGHPWNEEVTVKVDDLQHPLNAAFGGKSFAVADEIYQFKAPYTRDRLHVLLSLDTGKTNMTKGGINRQDGDFAVSWVRNYGLGRVFFCSLGHRHDIFWNPAVLQHYLAGVQFALGDLPADALPSAQYGADGWISLLNGKDLTGWFAKPGSWAVDDGALVCKGGGYIWAEQPFSDFVLDLKFRISEQGNSGIFFRTADTKDCVQTGIEMQILDSHGKAAPDAHDCGAIYDCLAPSKNAAKPAGEWNHVILTCRGSRIQVELNGESIIDMDLERWTEAGRNPDGTANKFKIPYKDMPRAGRIGFQDHGNPVWYREIRLKRL